MEKPLPFEPQEPHAVEDEPAYELPPAVAFAMALRLSAEYGDDRARRLAAFHRELAARLASLGRGERADPVIAQQRLRQKSREFRRQEA
jgi:hypothetical protein